MERRISAGTWMALGAGISALLATALVAAAVGMHEGWKNVAVAALPLLPAVSCALATRQGRATRRLRALAVALSLAMCAVGLWGTATGLRAERPAAAWIGTACVQTEPGNRPGSAAQ